jgi:DNA polymerase-3 subunit alpha
VVEVLVFPRAFQRYSRYVQAGSVVLLRGSVDLKEDTPKIIANDLFPFDEAYKLVASLSINLSGMRENIFESLKKMLESCRGSIPVYLHLDTAAKSRVQLVVGEGLYVSPSEKLVRDIEELVGDGRLSLAM